MMLSFLYIGCGVNFDCRLYTAYRFDLIFWLRMMMLISGGIRGAGVSAYQWSYRNLVFCSYLARPAWLSIEMSIAVIMISAHVSPIEIVYQSLVARPFALAVSFGLHP